MKIPARFYSFPAPQNIRDSKPPLYKTRYKKIKRKKNTVMPALVYFYIGGHCCTNAYSLSGQRNGLLITWCCSHGGLFQAWAFV